MPKHPVKLQGKQRHFLLSFLDSPKLMNFQWYLLHQYSIQRLTKAVKSQKELPKSVSFSNFGRLYTLWLPKSVSFSNFGRLYALLATQIGFFFQLRSLIRSIGYPNRFLFPTSVVYTLYWLPKSVSFSNFGSFIRSIGYQNRFLFPTSVVYTLYWLPKSVSFSNFGRLYALLTTQIGFFFQLRSFIRSIGYPNRFLFPTSVVYMLYWLPKSVSFSNFGRLYALLATKIGFFFQLRSFIRSIGYPNRFLFPTSVVYNPMWYPIHSVTENNN